MTEQNHSTKPQAIESRIRRTAKRQGYGASRRTTFGGWAFYDIALNYAVTDFDFGMTDEEALEWLKDEGEDISPTRLLMNCLKRVRDQETSGA